MLFHTFFKLIGIMTSRKNTEGGQILFGFSLKIFSVLQKITNPVVMENSPKVSFVVPIISPIMYKVKASSILPGI